MPCVQFLGRKLTKDQKTELIRAFTDAVSNVVHVRKEVVYVYIAEHSDDDIGVGGIAIADRPK